MGSGDIPMVPMRESPASAGKDVSEIFIGRGVMPRDIPVGNGSFLVAFDRDYLIRDIYFPQVGGENHANGHPFRFGIWVDGQFSQMGPEWSKELRYVTDTLVTEVKARNERL